VIFNFFRFCDLMTFMYTHLNYSLKVYRMCKYELPLSGFRKLLPDIQTRLKLQSGPEKNCTYCWWLYFSIITVVFCFNYMWVYYVCSEYAKQVAVRIERIGLLVQISVVRPVDDIMDEVSEAMNRGCLFALSMIGHQSTLYILHGEPEGTTSAC